MTMKSLFSIAFLVFAAFAIAAQDSAWVQVRIPVACIREGRGHATEMSSQAIMGMPMLILEEDTLAHEWLKLQAPDGYVGYMNISSVARKTHDAMAAWRRAPRLVMTAMAEAKVYSDTLGLTPRNIVTELVNGSIVEGVRTTGKYTRVVLPDGRSGYVESAMLSPIETWASAPLDTSLMLERCYTLMGTPYLWGGASTKSVDCSGLVRVSLYANGVLTLRDARQQIEIGQRIEPDDTGSLERGDLLFFSKTPDGRISHVAVYDSDGSYIHSSGRVKVNRMSPDDEDFAPRCYRGASRIAGMTGTPGIWQIIDHPWYFQ